jgi:hypothetical protein
MNKLLSFCFKGSRTYAHGADIVKALYHCFPLSSIDKIDLKFNGLASTNLELVSGNLTPNPKVNIRVSENGQDTLYQLIESGGKIECRYEYDEGSLLEKCELDLKNQQIYMNGVTGYTLCENFVAMNKYLLQSLFPTEQGKWLFTRLEQSTFIPDESLITVKLIKNFNFRLTKSDILLGNQTIGSVYYTMARSQQ